MEWVVLIFSLILFLNGWMMTKTLDGERNFLNIGFWFFIVLGVLGLWFALVLYGDSQERKELSQEIVENMDHYIVEKEVPIYDVEVEPASEGKFRVDYKKKVNGWEVEEYVIVGEDGLPKKGQETYILVDRDWNDEAKKRIENELGWMREKQLQNHARLEDEIIGGE